jgi:FemAB-related protein (PEP-CTERM system-associated)
MQIIECDESHRHAWNAYVERRASFYHRFEWRDVNDRLGHRSAYLCALEGDEVVGILPITQVRSLLLGNIACSVPFVNYGGPCAEEPEIERLLVEQGIRVAERWRVDYLEIRCTKRLQLSLRTSEHKVSLTVDLEPGSDALWNGFGHSHRKDIKRGYRSGFTTKIGGVELLNDFYAVISEAWRNMGTPIYSKRYFEDVARTLGQFIRLCVIYKDDEPAAASFQAHDRGVGEGLWLGSRGKYRDQYAGYVLYWELLKDAAARGCRTFHLGRSTSATGTEANKKKWNANSTQLYWHYAMGRKQQMPALNVDNPKFKLAIRTWRQLPIRVTTFMGPALAHWIP